jgi:endonuclease/exonuclease/phosphatase (EEP) superfamily protein YafD
MKDPTIVAGDFNSVRDSAVHGAMRAVMSDAHEHGAWGPGATVRALGIVPLRVDYVYISSHLTVASTRIPPYDCADHRPTLTRLSVE